MQKVLFKRVSVAATAVWIAMAAVGYDDGRLLDVSHDAAFCAWIASVFFCIVTVQFGALSDRSELPNFCMAIAITHLSFIVAWIISVEYLGACCCR
ncbi:MAG: hypothetical protein GC159_00425 [Phycisphaera sp.]|nr:hypothetical protein [Phycisphaera sp.]